MNVFKSYNDLIESENFDRLQKIFTRYDFFKKIINVPGDIVECGVFKGTGQIFWLKLLRIYDEYSMKKVIGFDTFNDFPKSILKYEKKEADKFIKESDNFSFIAQTVEYLNSTGGSPSFFEMRYPANPNANKRRESYLKII